MSGTIIMLWAIMCPMTFSTTVIAVMASVNDKIEEERKGKRQENNNRTNQGETEPV
jgi:hypothetical protein